MQMINSKIMYFHNQEDFRSAILGKIALEIFGGRADPLNGSQQHKIGFLTQKTTHSAKISFLKRQKKWFLGVKFSKIFQIFLKTACV